jgi:hypothetical protein
MRAKGKITYVSPPNPVAEEAAQWYKEQEEARKQKAEARANRPLLNKHTYAWLYEAWKPGEKLPTCNRCEAILQWDEPAHVCPGFEPKYVDWDAEKREAVAEYLRTGDGYADWDDDQYDPTVDGHIEKNPDEEDSGVIIEGMTEEEWLQRKFGNR